MYTVSVITHRLDDEGSKHLRNVGISWSNYFFPQHSDSNPPFKGQPEKLSLEKNDQAWKLSSSNI
jgi:hypothetical protein